MSLDVHPLLDELNLARQTTGAKAATMTFAVFFDDPSIADWIRERTHAVAERHPSRVIVLDGTQTPDARSIVDPDDPRGEWIEVGVKDSDAASLSGALSTLALAEAPVVLAWIAARISKDERFVRLAERAHTVICNSSVTDTGIKSLRDFIAFCDAHVGINAQDLAYIRLAGWQDLIAEFFDQPGAMEELSRLRRVEITAGSEAEAYYLLGWLASRLEWSPCGKNQMCNRDNEAISFEIVQGGQPRRLQRVVLQSEETTFSAHVFEEDPNAICLEAIGKRPQDRRCAPMLGVDIASLVERAILQQQRDRVFHETLAVIEHIIDFQRR